MNFKLTLFATLLFTNHAFADKLTVYRWIDKNNVVHFSQHQPDHNNYVEISMSNNKSGTVDTPLATMEDLTKLSSNVGDVKDESVSRCDTAKENLKILSDFEKIQYKDTAGNVKVLGDLEKQQQLEMNKKQAEVYCQ
jgi:phosphatidate phosphatase PAH1